MSPLLLLTLGLMTLIAVLSLIPGSSQPVRSCPLALQKAGHVVLYGVLAALWMGLLAGAGAPVPGAAAAAWLLASGFGGLMELGQRRCPGRVGSWADVARNTAGAALGVLGSLLAWP